MSRDWISQPPGACVFAEVSEGQAFPRLENDEVHVWKARLDGRALQASLELLSPDEVARAGRYRFERDRRRFVVGRAMLRTILGGYLDRKPRELAFLHGAQGKPRLALKHWMDSLHFNVSHTDSLALYAVARGGEVGIDIERIRDVPDWSDIADIFFAPWEQDGLRDLPDDRRRLAFLQAWTRREALLKTSGAGLAGENDGCLTAQEDGFPVHSFIPEPGYLAAVACVFPAPRVTFLMPAETAGPERTITFATQNNLT